MQDPQNGKKSPSGHHRAILSGYIFATMARIDNREKVVKQQYLLLHTSSQCGELRPIRGWDLLASLRHPCKFQRVSCLCSVTARHSSSGRQPYFATLSRGRHLYSAGRPSRWALAHILVVSCFTENCSTVTLDFVIAVLTCYLAFSVLTLLAGHHEEHPVCKKWFAYRPVDATATHRLLLH